MEDQFTDSEHFIHYKRLTSKGKPTIEILDVSSAIPRSFKLKQTASTVVHVRFNFEHVADFTSKKLAKEFLNELFAEKLPFEASSSFRKEMIVAFEGIIKLL